MVLKFKVYRLRWEKRGKKLILVLRGKNGKFLRTYKTAIGQFRIQKWYIKYNREAGLEQLLAVRKLKEHVKGVKKQIRKHGFIYQISLYGIFKDPKTGKRFYCRYEVFKATKWDRHEVAGIHDFLKDNRPVSAAGCFVYHDDKLLVWNADRVTKHGTEVLGYTGERRSSQMDGELQVGGD